jgi:integrase
MRESGCAPRWLLEALRLRVKDLDFERGKITVREGKGDKDRLTMLPQAVIRPLREHCSALRRFTSRTYTHVLNRGGRGVRSPADGLARRPDER